MNRDTRILGGQNFEVRANGTEGRTIVGYAAVFNQPTEIAGLFREQIAPGAFTEALRTDDVHAVFNHDYGLVLGRMASGTLRADEDDKGLKVEIDLPDTQDARDLVTKMERGDIDQMSFRFDMNGGKEEWDDTGELPLRTINQVGELHEVSVVPRGAYPQTEAGVRSFEAHARRRNFSNAQRRLKLKLNLGLGVREKGVAKAR